MQFSTLVRETRIGRGMSIKELAILARFDPSYISLVEHGHKNPRIANALKLAKALGIDVGLLRLIDEKFIPQGLVKERGYEVNQPNPYKKRSTAGAKRRKRKNVV